MIDANTRAMFPLPVMALAALLAACAQLPPNERPRDDTARSEPASFVSPRASLTGAEDVLFQAFTLHGLQYNYGGRSPENGFDCSGFVHYVYREAVGKLLPTNAAEQARAGRDIERTALLPGDLVFFNTLKRAFSHVGIYVGNGRFIHSPSTGKRIEIVDMNDGYWKPRFNGARRVLAD